MTTCQVESFSSFAPELGRLPQGHQEEADPLHAAYPRRVVVEPFYAIEKTGKLFCVSLRDENDRLIGYCGGVIAPDPQRTTIDGQPVTIFSELGVYVTPERRGHGFKMTKMLIREAIARGAEIIYLRGPVGSRAARFFEALGAIPVETTYAIVVKKADADARNLPSRAAGAI